MAANQMPAADVVLDEAVVRRLLRSQHPDLADLSIVELSHGWDNVMFRLGDDLLVRMPRRAVASVLIDHEQLALRRLAQRLPLPVPAPVRAGHPDGDYPYPWSVVPWIDGQALGTTPFADPTAEANRLGGFLAALHRPAPADAPINTVRGHFIADNDGVFCERVASAREVLDQYLEDGASGALRRWSALIDVDPFDRVPMWLHGDLHALNLVERNGRVVAVVDWGDVCAGDPAVDLAVAWTLFDRAERDVFRSAAAIDGRPVEDATWQRAEAWALHFCVMYLANSADHPALRAVGQQLAARLAVD